MKMSINIIITLTLILLMGCQEAKYKLFCDVARVRMLVGEEDFIDFYYLDESINRDTAYLLVRVMGGPVDRERRIAFKQVSEYDVEYKYDEKGNLVDSVVTEKPYKAVPGVHYVSMDDEEMSSALVIKPNETMTKVPVILLRDTSLQTNQYRLCLQLVETPDFQLGESSSLKSTIVFSDKLSKPSFWDGVVDDWVFGTWSLRKHEFMIEVLQTEINDAWYKKVGADDMEEAFVVSKLKDALDAYNADLENIQKGLAPMREDVKDPNSPLIVFP